jgi:hypothetical protein
MGDAIHRLDHLDIVSPRGELFKGVPIGKGFFEFCTAQRIAKASNLKRAADPSQNKFHFSESWQGAYNVRFLQRVDINTQKPMLAPPNGLVLISDEAKLFYEMVVSQRPTMSNLHGAGSTPHQTLRKLMAGTPRRNHEWRVLKPTQSELFAWMCVPPEIERLRDHQATVQPSPLTFVSQLSPKQPLLAMPVTPLPIAFPTAFSPPVVPPTAVPIALPTGLPTVVPTDLDRPVRERVRSGW